MHSNSIKNLIFGSKRKYSINDDFLSNISEYKEDEAYFLGWMYSDGYLSLKYNKLVKFSLAEKDMEVLKSLKNIIQFEGPINIAYRKPSSILNGPVKKYQDRAYIQFTGPKIIPKLIELGMDTRKSTETGFPFYFKKEYWNHFILALFEGDGSFSFCNKTGKSETNLVINPILAKDIEKIFLEELGIQCHYAKKVYGNGAVTLRFCGNKQMLKFFIWLYRDNKYKLNRKFQVFKKIIDYVSSVTNTNPSTKEFLDDAISTYNLYNV